MRAAPLRGTGARWTLTGFRPIALAWPSLTTLAVSLLLAEAFFLVRVPVARSPALSETYYDEALTGLMALEILRGSPQVFYWGEPYGGAIGDAYLAAAGFRLFGPSTLVLRLSALVVVALWGWAVWQMARRTAGEVFGLWAGLYMALPPVFVSFVQLSSSGEAVAVTGGAVAVAATVRLLDRDLSPRANAVAWTVLGLAAGVGWWASQIMGMFLATIALTVAVSRPRSWRTVWPYAALGLFVFSSLPLWIWNLQHDWATFRHLARWGGGPPPLPEAASSVTRTLVATLRDRYWDARGVPLPPAGQLLGQLLLVAVYAPAVILAVLRVVTWIRRAWRREQPWREPLDVVVLAFWLTVAAHASTWFGTAGVLRYSITFYVTLPVLCATLLARVARLGRPGAWLAATLAASVLGYNGWTHVAFLEASKQAPWRPVDAAIARLEQLGIRACYADSRIAQVITFESRERIVCADYLGYRNFRQLQAVDAIEDPARVAIVLHRTLQGPAPAMMVDTLELLRVAAQREVVGEYEILHHFTPLDPSVAPIPTEGWRGSASNGAAALAFDRQAWTRWSVPKRPGEWLALDLGSVQPVTQVSVLPGPWVSDAPAGMRVETSLDGERWAAAASSAQVLAGVHWWKGHPRIDESGRVVVRFLPRPARHVRLTSLGAMHGGASWSIAEIFVYAPAAALWSPPAAATTALAAAARGLDHWMDDPTGPHPRRAPVTTEHRRRQVPWDRVLGEANAALAAAPEWEDPHHLYGLALARFGWDDGIERTLDRAHRQSAWLEVARLAQLIDSEPDATWRAGRLAAWADALERLDRPAEAAAIRARPEPAPTRFARTRFGQGLELRGLDAPTQVRPGETVHVRYYWRLLDATAQDYWVFLHVPGLPGGGNYDQPVGGPAYGLSQWARGELVRQTVALAIPADTAPGAYPMRLGTWLPSTGRRLRVLSSDLPQARRAVTIGTLVVSR